MRQHTPSPPSLDWNGRPVLVTGAGGFVGSHLVEQLLARGARVRAMVHGDPLYRPGHLAGLEHPALELIGGDVRDAAFTRAATQGMDTIFHLAAVTSVAYAYAHPEETLQTNGLGTQHICAGAREAGVRRLVHTSTAGVYGNAREEAPIAETHPVMGCNPYTSGKLAGDFTAQAYHLSYDLPVTTVRLFNVYGPRMGRYLIMPAIIQQLLKGPALHLGDLSPTRTFTYVDDIVRAYLRMAEVEEMLGETVHFGSTNAISMRELVEKIAAIMAVPYELIQDPARLRPAKSEIYRIQVNHEKATRVLGWTPEVSLEEGLRRTIVWFRNLSEQAAKPELNA